MNAFDCQPLFSKKCSHIQRGLSLSYPAIESTPQVVHVKFSNAQAHPSMHWQQHNWPRNLTTQSMKKSVIQSRLLEVGHGVQNLPCQCFRGIVLFWSFRIFEVENVRSCDISLWVCTYSLRHNVTSREGTREPLPTATNAKAAFLKLSARVCLYMTAPAKKKTASHLIWPGLC